jgi:malate synthase
MATSSASLESLDLTAPLTEEHAGILTPAAQAFLIALHRRFEAARTTLLERRTARQRALDAGHLPDFLPETRAVRESRDWRVAPPPRDLQDRRVEITGPVERKMIINALNSGAQVFMADFEDATSPTWDNVLSGQINLVDAVRRTISFSAPEGKTYALNPQPATLMVRPRGWHLPEKHARVDGAPMSASLFDFGLFFFHNARALLAAGSGPYFYLPKLEGYLEARLWNDVFCFAQDELRLPRGTIRATVLIETVLGAFEAEEILHELREHSAGLNCGRWDYIFSFIKKLQAHRQFVLPDRGKVTMVVPFMRAYCRHVIQVCHRRGAHAMGGMAAQIPIRNDPVANEAALARVKADKLREVADGHDGTWVAHPGLVALARAAFDQHMPGPNQIGRVLPEVQVSAADLLAPPAGEISEEGLRLNLRVGIRYLESWLRGNGCVPLYHLMEDAATAEISRAQVWQWLKFHATLVDGRRFTPALYEQLLAEEIERITAEVGAETFKRGRFTEAIRLFSEMAQRQTFEDFLTLPAYALLR